MDRDTNNYLRYLNGDWDGLREIIDEYYPGLVSFLRNRYVRPHDAEDIAQETFLVIAEKRSLFAGQSSFKTWMYRIARNLAVTYLRKKQREELYMPEDLDGFTQIGERDVTDAHEEEKQLVQLVLPRLREKYRQVLWMKYFAKMSVEEIAVTLDKSLDSVNGLLRRARKDMEKELRKEGYHR